MKVIKPKKIQAMSWNDVQDEIKQRADKFEKLPVKEQEKILAKQEAILKGLQKGGLEGAVKAAKENNK